MAKNLNRDYTKPNNPIDLDWEQFDKLCAIFCTLIEIADYFGVSQDTVHEAVQRKWGVNFSEYYARRSSIGKRSLRRRQFEKAKEGDTKMLIHLGKKYLGQDDNGPSENREIPKAVYEVDVPHGTDKE